MISGANMLVIYKNMAWDHLENLRCRREAMINAALAGGSSPGMAFQVADSEFGERIAKAEAAVEGLRLQQEAYDSRRPWWRFW